VSWKLYVRTGGDSKRTCDFGSLRSYDETMFDIV